MMKSKIEFVSKDLQKQYLVPAAKAILVGVLSVMALSASGATSANKLKLKNSVIDTKEPSPWSLTFTSENVAPGQILEDGAANETESENTIGFKYKVDDQLSVWAGQAFKFNYRRNSSLAFSDMVLGYDASHTQYGINDFNFESSMHLYLPVSTSSQEIGQHQWRTYLTLKRRFGSSSSIYLTSNPRLFGYTRHQNGQLGSKWKNYVGASTALGPIGFDLKLGHSHYNYFEGKKYNPEALRTDWVENPYNNDDAAFYEFRMATDVAAGVSVLGLVIQEHDLRASESFEFLNPAETVYLLILDVSI